MTSEQLVKGPLKFPTGEQIPIIYEQSTEENQTDDERNTHSKS